jgi:hypothetical protein
MQRRLVRDSQWPRAYPLLAHRATLQRSACGHPVDKPYSIRHLVSWRSFQSIEPAAAPVAV